MNQSSSGLLWTVFFITSACSTGSGDSIARRTVRATCNATYWHDDGSKSTSSDCTGAELNTRQPDGAGQWSGLATFAKTKDGYAGSAQEGTYLLGAKYTAYSYWEYFETSADSFDLGYDVAGRSDVQWPSSSTPVTFNVDGLDPWDVNDYLQLTSSGCHAWGEIAAPTKTASFATGASSGQVAFDWYGTGKGLPDGSKGDAVYVYQGKSQTIPGGTFSYQAVSRAAQLPASFRVVSGVSQTQSVSLEAVSQTGSLSIDWRLSEFERYAPDIHPNSTPKTHMLLVDAEPHTLTGIPSMVSRTPDMMILSLPSGTPDQDITTLTYGQFLPSFWVEFRQVHYKVGLSITAPGAATATELIGTIGRRDPLPASNGAVLPAITPPRSPMINGIDAFQSPAGVGTTPMFSWSAPALGTATHYVIEIASVVNSNGATAFEPVAYLTTVSSAIRMPPGPLQAGTQYVGYLTAYFVTSDAPETAPYRYSIPNAWATTLLTFNP